VAYKVVGECAHVTVMTNLGATTQLVYKGALVPESTAPETIQHLLSVGLIRQVAGPAPADDAAPTEGSAPAVVAPSPSDAETLSEERLAAREKLPADGPPHANAGEPVWIEYAVVKGYDYEAAKSAGKAELRRLLEQQQ